MPGTETGERKGVALLNADELRRFAVRLIPDQDISWVESHMHQAFSYGAITHPNPGQFPFQQIVGAVQAPQISFGSHFCEKGGIDQQNALGTRQGSRRQAQIQQRTPEPEEPGTALLEAFVPTLSRDEGAADVDQPTPSAQLLEGRKAEYIPQHRSQQCLSVR